MAKRSRFQIGFAAMVAAGPAMAAPAGTGTDPAATADWAQIAQSSEPSEEAGVAAADNIAYLTNLALVRGHLNVGVDLYGRGAVEAAATHMKHPGDELYASLVPALRARGAPGFAEELERLALLVEAGAPADRVMAAHRVLEKAIADHEGAVAATLSHRLQVVVALVRTAAEEYEIGVVDGEVVNAHEYQDALGFVRIARALVDGLGEEERARAGAAVATIRAQLDGIESAWPDVVPPARVDGQSDDIYVAAARIEIVARTLD